MLHGFGGIDSVDVAIRKCPGKAPADVAGPTAEIQYPVAWSRVGEALPEQRDKVIVRLAEISPRIGQRLPGFVHQFGFGNTLHGYQ